MAQLQIHVYHHFEAISIRQESKGMAGRLDRIEAMLDQLRKGNTQIMATLADIKAKVEAEKTVEESAVALMVSISQQLKDALVNNDPAAVQEIADMLDANTRMLSDAVTANTSAAPSA